MEFNVLITTIIFFGSGFYALKIEDRTWANCNGKNSTEKTLVNAFILSILTNFFNYLVINYIFKIDIRLIENLISRFSSFKFLFCYVLLTSVTSYASIYALHYYHIARIKIKNVLKNKNIFKKSDNITLVEETTYPTIWDSIMSEKNDFINPNIIFSIEQNDKISYGHVGESPRLNSTEKEIKLIDTVILNGYMEHEEFKNNYVKRTKYEYYDLDRGYIIRCYELEDDAFNKFHETYNLASPSL